MSNVLFVNVVQLKKNSGVNDSNGPFIKMSIASFMTESALLNLLRFGHPVAVLVSHLEVSKLLFCLAIFRMLNVMHYDNLKTLFMPF